MFVPRHVVQEWLLFVWYLSKHNCLCEVSGYKLPTKGLHLQGTAVDGDSMLELDSNYTTKENGTEIHLAVLRGDTAFLPCRAQNLAQRTVSWVRRRDWHILTSGSLLYTNDERFHVLHRPGGLDWVLQLKFAQDRDSGVYECQITTGGGIVSQFVHLDVVAPKATIVEGPDYHVDAGSSITLTCVIDKSPIAQQFVFWYHNSRMVNNDPFRKGASTSLRTTHDGQTESVLSIDRAKIADSGNYTCKASNADPVSVAVYVSQGDYPAAVQGQSSSSLSCLSAAWLLLPLNLIGHWIQR